MPPVRQPRELVYQIARDPPVHCRPMNPDPCCHLDDISTVQHRTDRIQTLLNHRQDNQCQSRLAEGEGSASHQPPNDTHQN